MTLGQDIKVIVDGLISDVNIRTSLTLTPRTIPATSDGGYSGTNPTDGTPRIIYAVPSRYVKNRFGLFKFGDLQEGEFRFLVSSDESISENDKVTFDGNNYVIRTQRFIPFNEIMVAQSIILVKLNETLS